MFVKLLANKYLGCSQFLTLMNKASMNITVQVFYEWVFSHLFDNSENVGWYNRYTFKDTVK